jgi:hypothetical protein
MGRLFLLSQPETQVIYLGIRFFQKYTRSEEKKFQITNSKFQTNPKSQIRKSSNPQICFAVNLTVSASWRTCQRLRKKSGEIPNRRTGDIRFILQKKATLVRQPFTGSDG